MKPRELLELIEEGENLTCEFKRKFSTTEKIAREMIAFANTKGGYLVIGVDDDKEIIGVESEKAEAELIYDAANNFCEPPLNINIDYVEVKGKEVVVVEIFESDNKPHRIQDYLKELDVNQSVVHIRVNDKIFFNDTATTEIYTLPLHDALPISWGGIAGLARSSSRTTPCGLPLADRKARP